MADELQNMENQTPDSNYWKSFEELHRDKDFLKASHDEFLEGVKSDFNPEEDLSGLSRRKFLALLGASAALAGAGCSDYRDKGEIIPYNRKPEEVIVGKPNYYASTCTACSLGCGILVKTREGRPIKVEGNPDHPVNKGKICATGQAHILNLYDPSRLREPLAIKNGGSHAVDSEAVDTEIIKALKNAGQKEIAFITGKVISPTQKKLFDELTAVYPSTKVYSYEQFSDLNRISAWQKTYGTTPALIAWEDARIILSLEGDFLGREGNHVEQTRLFAQNRAIENIKSFSRLYTVEANLSLTGMNSDYRFRLKPELQYDFVMSLLNDIVVHKNNSSISVDGTVRSALSAFSLGKFTSENNIPAETLQSLVRDLIANKGKAIVFAGNALDEKTHIAVNLLNEVIGAHGLYRTNASAVSLIPEAGIAEFENLVTKLNANQVAAVIHVDVNPVFTLPQDLGYSKALQRVDLVVSLSEYENETTSVSKYVLPIHHTFESWGDAQVRSNVVSTLQPIIAPLYGTRQKESILLFWLGGNPASSAYKEDNYHIYLMANWEKSMYPETGSTTPFQEFWYSVLHDGVLLKKRDSAKSYSLNSAGLQNLNSNRANVSGFSLLITEALVLHDGRHANNGWLQELAHPVSKVAWDNYAALSEKTSKELGVTSNDIVEISLNGKTVHLPVLMQPGLADKFISIETGYGRSKGTVVAVNVGQDVNILQSKNNKNTPFYFTNVSIKKVSGKSKLATTQDHHTYDEALIKDLHKKREIIREGTVLKYQKDPAFLHEEKKEEAKSIYTQMEYTGVKWGMAIDLNKCTGCSECIMACNVENNVPVVGKDQVLKSREMQWLRIDRYYSGTPENPQVSVQPMLCQHCDNAPCENVCPVVATNHSPDGLNQMIYNRCVGTRYCSNNCPYKVRRFNFFNFRDHFADGYYTQDSITLARNPEVTVRSRGVMEKCTFCVHRIAEARADATKDGKTFTGEGVTTACQDACSANAIVFGNVNDPNTEVAKLRNHKLGYVVLEELNIKPNVTYVAKLRNTYSEEV